MVDRSNATTPSDAPTMQSYAIIDVDVAPTPKAQRKNAKAGCDGSHNYCRRVEICRSQRVNHGDL